MVRISDITKFTSQDYPGKPACILWFAGCNMRCKYCHNVEFFEQKDNYLTIYFTLKDKFGDHGLISVVIMKKVDNETLFIDTWLMSCRVLKRGMEEFIVNTIIDTARKNGYKTVQGEYIKTPKNTMVEKIYEKLGFKDNGSNIYTADVNTFRNNITFIKEI